MGILGSEYQWAHVEWCQPQISWSQLKRKGGKGSRRASFANEEGESKWYGLYQGSYEVPSHQQSLFIKGHRHLLGIPGHQRLPAVKWSSTFLCLYQVMGDSLFIPGHWRFLVYTRRSELFTPVAAVWRALLEPKYSRGAIPGPFA